jgi:hypothetical protein
MLVTLVFYRLVERFTIDPCHGVPVPLNFSQSHGALLNAVKPEMLLDLEDFGRILTARDSNASSEHEKEGIALWGEVELNFATISAQAWNMLIFQVG